MSEQPFELVDLLYSLACQLGYTVEPKEQKRLQTKWEQEQEKNQKQLEQYAKPYYTIEMLRKWIKVKEDKIKEVTADKQRMEKLLGKEILRRIEDNREVFKEQFNSWFTFEGAGRPSQVRPVIVNMMKTKQTLDNLHKQKQLLERALRQKLLGLLGVKGWVHEWSGSAVIYDVEE